MNKVITVLADQVEWLRWQLDKTPHMSQALHSVGEPQQPYAAVGPAAPDFNPFISEEEEELLALRINEHITEQELETLRGEVAKVISLPRLEPDV